MIPEAILSEDPGDDTGLAWLWGHGTAFFACEYKPLTAADHIEATCRDFGPRLTILCERYDIRTKLPQTHAYDAIGLIMVTRWMAARYGCRLIMVPQHTPKPPERKQLEAIGWWVKGMNDAQSAAWHLLAWLDQSSLTPPRERAILSEVRATL